MTTKRRERKTPRAAHAPAAAGSTQPQAGLPPLPPWHWRTFPVYFAGALGLFLGVYAGYLVGFVHAETGNGTPTLVLFVTAALLLGFGLSRLTSRLMITRRWVKPRPKRK
ncbi:MAG: hypothetical protein HY875_06215 [Chloroflexi bacterium]|nr:hypothetical protein [Chloroflexota bacterium]